MKIDFKSYVKRITVLLILIMSGSLCAQDAFFSQIKANDIYFNPARSFNPLISNTRAKFDLQFRDQWNGIDKGDAYATTKFESELNVYKSNLDAWNVGVFFINDNSSSRLLKQTLFTLSSSYTRKISGSYRSEEGDYITAGISYSFAQTNLDLSNVWFSRQFDLNLIQIDPEIASGEVFGNENTNYRSLILGLRWLRMIDEQEYLAADFSLSHVNMPGLNTSNPNNILPSKINFGLQSKLNIVESFFHAPSINFSYQAGYYQLIPSYRIIVGIESQEENDFSISVGAGLRVVNNFNGIGTDAALFFFGVSSESWSFDFSFDMTTSALSDYTNKNGAIELSLGYRILNR